LGREKQRGGLTLIPEREQFIEWINGAVAAGARRCRACNEVGMSLRTLQRWMRGVRVSADARTTCARSESINKLSEQERQQVLSVCSSPEYASLPPCQIMPRLADKGIYIASDSTIYHALKANECHRRGRTQAPGKHKAPTSYRAEAANQVWSWDITYLPTRVRGQFYYLYLFEDMYSRKAVGWEVYEQESSQLVAGLLQRIVMTEQCFSNPPALHSDNAPMKSLTLLAKMYDLGITPSRGRPRVSNDTPYSESLFRTLKYCPQWPAEGFATLDDARVWVREFIERYNRHYHSRIRFVTLAKRHRGEDKRF
jgi:putative transposase